MQNNNNNKPLLVQIPETGQWLNVRPLINFLLDEKMETLQEAPAAITDEIDSRIKSLNIHFTFDVEDIADPRIPQGIFQTIYDLRDLFNSFTVIKK